MKYTYKYTHILLIFALLLIPTIAFASMPIMPGYNIQGNNHYYSLLLDGEGEAIVNLKIDVRDYEESIDSYLLEIPYSQVRVLGVYEKVLESQKTCIQWENTCIQRGAGTTCVEYDYNGNCLKEEAPCLQYGRTCVSYSSGSQRYEYKKLDVQPQELSDKTLLNINFEQPATPNEAKELIVAVKIYDSVDKSLGKLHLSFETFGTDRDLYSVAVGVNVPEDYIIKGGNSRINYRSDFLTYASSMENSKTISNNDMDQYSRYIQNSYQYRKTTSNLDPFETFTMDVTYSRTWFALYWPSVLLGLLIIAAIIVGIVFAVRKLKLSLAKLKTNLKTNEDKTHTGLISFLGGLFVSLGIIILWVIIILVGRLLSSSFRQGSEAIFYLIVGLLGVIITLGLMIGIPIYVGSKYKPKTGFFLALWMFGWLFILAILIFIFFAIFL